MQKFVGKPGYGLKAYKYKLKLDDKLLKRGEREQRRQFWNH